MSGFSQIPSDNIRKHQTNRSTSKNAYPFSKSQRFPNPNPEYFLLLFLDAKMHSIHMTANFQIERLLSDREKNPTSPRI